MIKHKLAVVFVSIVLTIIVGGNATAAFKKNDQPAAHKKNRYRIDVLVPLYLDELAKNGKAIAKDKIPEKAQPGMAFYAGINIAADSLKKEGFNIDIYVHDVASANESPVQLISKGKLDSSDLVIGDVQPQDVLLLSGFAKAKKINFVSTAPAFYGDAKNNTYLTLLQPSLQTQCERIVAEVVKNAPDDKITVLYRTKNAADNVCYDYITDAAGHKLHLQYMACSKPPGKGNLGVFIDATKPAVFIVPVSDISFADSLLHSLSTEFPDTHFDVYGMPAWAGIADLKKKGTFPNITVHISSAFSLDPSSVSGQYVRHMFTQFYTGKISTPVYDGYEALFLFAGLLKKYGTHFNENYEHTAAPSSFDIQPQTDRSGNVRFYENKHVFTVTFENGTEKR
jgi:hypothetical protein